MKSLLTRRALARQERRAAAARVVARAGGCVLAAGVEMGALEVARIQHRDACRADAQREAARRMPAAGVAPFGEPGEGIAGVGGWA